MASVTNTTKSEGGTGEESEESFRERIFLAPSSYSVAGPADAYEYWVKQYNSAAIEDVKIYEPTEAVVDIRILLNGGVLPSKTFCSGCLEYLKENFEMSFPSLNQNVCDTQTYQKNLQNALYWTHSVCGPIRRECFRYDIWAYSKIFYHLELYNKEHFQRVYHDMIQKQN